MKRLSRLLAPVATGMVFAINATAQSVRIDEQSMRDAWSRQQSRFESLSTEAHTTNRGRQPPAAGHEHDNGHLARQKEARENQDQR